MIETNMASMGANCDDMFAPAQSLSIVSTLEHGCTVSPSEVYKKKGVILSIPSDQSSQGWVKNV